MNEQAPLPELQLAVQATTLPLFTTLLQSGIELKTTGGQPLGALLHTLPGFSADYLADRVQTIFLDGTAIDDLTTPLRHDRQVIALSAAMPGLAGAIFRRNSFHAALRTTTGKETGAAGPEAITVRIKFFNSIARERGPDLLRRGVVVDAADLAGFFADRPGLTPAISQARLAGTRLEPAELARLGRPGTQLRLRIVAADD